MRSHAAGALLQADLPDGTDARCACDAGDTVHLHWDDARGACARLRGRPLTRRAGAGAAPHRRAACACARISDLLYTRRGLLLLALLAPPLLWFGVVYLGALFALLANAFFGLDDFTGQVVREFTLKNFVALAEPANVDVARRTITMAVCVTLACTRARLSRSPTTWRAMPAARRRRCCTSR